MCFEPQLLCFYFVLTTFTTVGYGKLFFFFAVNHMVFNVMDLM